MTWYAFRPGPERYVVFDTFEGEGGRRAQRPAPAGAFDRVAGDLLAQEPDMGTVEVIAVR